MTAAELRNAQRAHERAASRYHHTREVRNRLVRAALEDGWTHAQIAQATGLTRSRVGQIALGARP